MTTALQTMAFNNEVVSDADIDRYNLPFQKGGLRWWTRDAERDYYLWGGLSGNPAFDDVLEGRFYLFVDGQIYGFILRPGKFNTSVTSIPFVVRWEKVQYIIPEPKSHRKSKKLISILKEALTVYGLHGERSVRNIYTRVEFKF
ncbi:MAG: hypothetical protein ACK6AD_00350 [Cyanobacteriota bacterium]